MRLVAAIKSEVMIPVRFLCIRTFSVACLMSENSTSSNMHDQIMHAAPVLVLKSIASCCVRPVHSFALPCLAVLGAWCLVRGVATFQDDGRVAGGVGGTGVGDRGNGGAARTAADPASAARTAVGVESTGASKQVGTAVLAALLAPSLKFDDDTIEI